MTLPEFFVPGERVGRLELAVPRGDLRPPEPNLGQELLAIPGMFGHSRATDAMEPAIRGLGFDRVTTTINGIPLFNASPERTNSPVVILGPAAASGVTVTKALPSVTLGPIAAGGLIALTTDRGPVEPGSGTPADALLSTTYNGARDGYSVRGRFTARSGAWDAGATFFRNDLGDYTAADGRQVAATLDDYGASASLGWRSTSRRIRAEYLHRRLRRQEAVSLPLDGKNSESQVFTLNDRWSFSSGSLETIEWRAGHASTDPFITSEDRAMPSLVFAKASARSTAGGANSTWRLGGDKLIAGGDYARQVRRAVRTTAAGKDYIWPNAVYTDVGLFGEWQHVIASACRLRLGARADDVRSDARDADRPALGQPIRQQYVTYNGLAAADVARHDRVGAANALLEWERGHDASAFVGIGVSLQPAQVTERYRAFLNALGGDGRGGNAVELGNPALQSERTWAMEAGGTWRHAWVALEATAYYYRIDDFILRTPVGTTQPPLTRMVVFGYRNVPVDLYGLEAGATLKPAEAWCIPLTFAIADGRRRDTGVGLADMPPWEATAAVRYRGASGRVPIAVEIGGRIVGARNNPAPLDNPLYAHTGGFAAWHARAGVPIGRNLRLEAGLENVFDRSYTEYLTPPVAPSRPASGNLLPGQRVPAPGRSAWLSTTFTW